MKKRIMSMYEKVKTSGVFLSLALVVVAVAEASSISCTVWIFGQPDMPEELL